jgi:hypothetical protein
MHVEEATQHVVEHRPAPFTLHDLTVHHGHFGNHAERKYPRSCATARAVHLERSMKTQLCRFL